MIRRAERRDARFLRDMLHHAFYARERVAGDDEQPVYRYVYNWGRPGDAGVLVLDEGFPVGAAWYRLFTADEPGYGFVDERTPELAIAVVPSRRGKGIGAELMTALLQQARADGYPAISLSVSADSPAVALYERLGFGAVAEHGESLTMRAELS